jgi:hypothetical protein
LLFARMGTDFLDTRQVLADPLAEFAHCRRLSFVQIKISPQAPVESIIVDLLRGGVWQLTQDIIASAVRVQVAAGLADSVGSYHERDLQVEVRQDLRGHRMKGVTVGVRLVADAMPVVAQDIQQVMGAQGEAHGVMVSVILSPDWLVQPITPSILPPA